MSKRQKDRELNVTTSRLYSRVFFNYPLEIGSEGCFVHRETREGKIYISEICGASKREKHRTVARVDAWACVSP